ncbi:MAG: outer membrane beta-barrel protein [Mucilaginibacter sp.]|nr:outer membrane beta-barrel protein [Mucilaginibacter sp.]
MRISNGIKCGMLTLLMLCFVLFAFGQTDKFASRIYFPGGIGLNIPSGDEQLSVRPGFSVITGVEYRPKYTNAIFFRFNYDALSNKYKSLPYQVPTNVIRGKLNADFFMLGVGYRRAISSKAAVYILGQPGISSSGYSSVSINSNGYSIMNVSAYHPAGKAAFGFEYYIVPHFALVAEPGYYHLFSGHGGFIINPNYVLYNIGFTTTLF